MTTTLYGIKNCDSCRKARRLLDARNVDFDYHDLRDDGLDAATLDAFLARVDWQTLLNTRSTTWRQLDAADKHPLDSDRARELMLAHPTLIKRPLLSRDDALIVGLDRSVYAGASD
ncbi:ArsC family reductase [Salinicola aestuarinus]|uniref:ArsC family reductase n=1 Tax=Salinicola aestuarinus TaxID=1949082 RepID=UPI000DA16E54|nr:ArsC family reductase [Salinicola aestuarinus]